MRAKLLLFIISYKSKTGKTSKHSSTFSDSLSDCCTVSSVGVWLKNSVCYKGCINTRHKRLYAMHYAVCSLQCAVLPCEEKHSAMQCRVKLKALKWSVECCSASRVKLKAKKSSVKCCSAGRGCRRVWHKEGRWLQQKSPPVKNEWLLGDRLVVNHLVMGMSIVVYFTESNVDCWVRWNTNISVLKSFRWCQAERHIIMSGWQAWLRCFEAICSTRKSTSSSSTLAGVSKWWSIKHCCRMVGARGKQVQWEVQFLSKTCLHSNGQRSHHRCHSNGLSSHHPCVIRIIYLSSL